MSQEQLPMSRRTVLFAGRVQGVGFRYTTCAVARSFQVTGTVRNLPDGRVEMVAEGEPGELTRLQAAVEEAMRGHIREIALSDGAASGEYTSFNIAY